MKVVRDYPHKVREVENLWITLQDGCRLAARLWLPSDADENPVPAILEYLPYRKRDGTIERDELMCESADQKFAFRQHRGVRNSATAVTSRHPDLASLGEIYGVDIVIHPSKEDSVLRNDRRRP